MEATSIPPIRSIFEQYRRSFDHHPLFFLGDAQRLLADLPDNALFLARDDIGKGRKRHRRMK